MRLQGEAGGLYSLIGKPVSIMKKSQASQFHTIQEALDEIRAGKFVILVDDEDRENEGDLVIAAEKISPG